MPAIPNFTAAALLACFAGVLAVFFLSAATRRGLARRQEPGPPPLPTGKVAVWPYQLVDLVWMGFIMLVFGALSIENASHAASHPEVTVSANGLVQSIGFQLILAGITVVVMIWRVRPISWLGLRWPQWRRALWIGPGAVILMWVLSIALYSSGYLEWLDSLGVEKMQDTVKLLQQNQDPQILALMAVAAVLVAPVCEEIMFRGYLYPAAKRFAGPWVAGLGSALVFAASHGSLSPLLPLFVFGCLLVLAYEWTGSLWAPITIHFCFNAATVIIQLAARYSGVSLPESL